MLPSCDWWFASALGLRGWRRALLLALATGVGNTYLQVTNGLETGFALAAIVAAIAAAYEVRIGAAAMFAGVLPWLRPDLGLIGGAILIAILWEHPRQWRRVFFIPLVIALPWALWALLDTGHLIPNTVNAKRVFFAEGCLPLASKLRIFGQGVTAWGVLMLPAAVIGVPGLFRGRLGRFLVVAAIATLGVFLVQLPGAVFYNHHRYLYPILLPALLYGSVPALREWSPRWVWLLLVASAWPLLSMQSDRADVWRTSANELIALREWVDQNIPADARIATHDAGVLR